MVNLYKPIVRDVIGAPVDKSGLADQRVPEYFSPSGSFHFSQVGLHDGDICRLPSASEGQVLKRGATQWEAGSGAGGVEEQEGDPVIVAHLAVGSNTSWQSGYGLAVFGNYAYMAHQADGKIYVIDISNPESPVKVGEFTHDDWSDPLDGPRFPVFDGRYLVVEGQGSSNAFFVLDMKNPASPQVLYHPSEIFGCDRGSEFFGERYAIRVISGHIRIMDFADPTSPEVLKDYTTKMSGAQHVWVEYPYAYVVRSVGSSEDVLVILDITELDNPIEVGSLQRGSNFSDNVEAIQVKGRYAFIADTGGDALAVVDVKDKTNPSFVSHVVDSTKLNAIKGFDISDRYAYCAASAYDGVTVVDISDPSNMTIVGSVSSSTYLDEAVDIKVQGRYAYVTSLNCGYFTVLRLKGYKFPTAHVGALYGRRAYIGELRVGRLIAHDVHEPTPSGGLKTFNADIDMQDHNVLRPEWIWAEDAGIKFTDKRLTGYAEGYIYWAGRDPSGKYGLFPGCYGYTPDRSLGAPGGTEWHEAYIEIVNANKIEPIGSSGTELTKPRIPNSPPSSSSDSGLAGEIRYDSNYLYVCVGSNQWKRVSLSSW